MKRWHGRGRSSKSGPISSFTRAPHTNNSTRYYYCYYVPFIDQMAIYSALSIAWVAPQKKKINKKKSHFHLRDHLLIRHVCSFQPISCVCVCVVTIMHTASTDIGEGTRGRQQQKKKKEKKKKNRSNKWRCWQTKHSQLTMFVVSAARGPITAENSCSSASMR